MLDSRSIDIVYVANPFQTDNRTSSHHIARQLAASHRLLYIEPGGLRSPRVNRTDYSKIVNKLASVFKPLCEVEKNVYVKSLFILPFGRFSVIRYFNRLMARWTIGHMKRKIGMRKCILWCAVPTLAEIVDEIEHELLVYYCVDDFAAMPDVDIGYVGGLDRKLTESADIVFTPSKPLFEKKVKINPNSHLSPHGVDLEHFSKARTEGKKPADISDIHGAILGFFGLIEYWIDIELIIFIAQQLPEVSVLMIGRIAVDLEVYDIPANVRFLGVKPYEELPDYARCFDVALIPYVLNDQVYNANPIKLREYLATGKPVVSVRSPEMNKYESVINIADSYDEYVEHIKRILRDGDKVSAEERIAAVQNESWAARFDWIFSLINERLESKQKPEY